MQILGVCRLVLVSDMDMVILIMVGAILTTAGVIHLIMVGEDILVMAVVVITLITGMDTTITPIIQDEEDLHTMELTTTIIGTLKTLLPQEMVLATTEEPLPAPTAEPETALPL